MYTNYSSRKFKKDHIRRLQLPKDASKSNGVEKTMQELLVEVVEVGLHVLEVRKKRIVPFGIREDEDG